MPPTNCSIIEHHLSIAIHWKEREGQRNEEQLQLPIHASIMQLCNDGWRGILLWKTVQSHSSTSPSMPPKWMRVFSIIQNISINDIQQYMKFEWERICINIGNITIVRGRNRWGHRKGKAETERRKVEERCLVDIPTGGISSHININYLNQHQSTIVQVT